MYRKRWRVLVLVALIGVLALAGCGETETREPGESEETTQEATAAAEATGTASAEPRGIPQVDEELAHSGWALVRERCVECHDKGVVDEARFEWGEWERAVDHMIENGANLNEGERQAVIEYLGTRDAVAEYGPSLVQQQCMVCHTTERVQQATLDWDGWSAAVNHMIEYGAQITEAERAVIVEYLALRGIEW